MFGIRKNGKLDEVYNLESGETVPGGAYKSADKAFSRLKDLDGYGAFDFTAIDQGGELAEFLELKRWAQSNGIIK